MHEKTSIKQSVRRAFDLALDFHSCLSLVCVFFGFIVGKREYVRLLMRMNEIQKKREAKEKSTLGRTHTEKKRNTEKNRLKSGEIEKKYTYKREMGRE